MSGSETLHQYWAQNDIQVPFETHVAVRRLNIRTWLLFLAWVVNLLALLALCGWQSSGYMLVVAVIWVVLAYLAFSHTAVTRRFMKQYGVLQE